MPHLTAFMLEILLLGQHDCINSRSNCMLRHIITSAIPCAEHRLPGTQVQALCQEAFCAIVLIEKLSFLKCCICATVHETVSSWLCQFKAVSSGPVLSYAAVCYTANTCHAIVWLQHAFCWNNSSWTSSRNKRRLHLLYCETLTYFSLVLVSWGGEPGVRVSVGWTPFPVARLDVAVLFWGLRNIIYTEVIRLCQLASGPLCC